MLAINIYARIINKGLSCSTLLTLFILSPWISRFKVSSLVTLYFAGKISLINEISNETNYSIVIKQSFIDGVFTIFSFGLYTPTTIILMK